MHALADSRHDRGGEIKGRSQHVFRDPLFPGVRQALIHSGLTISYNSDRDADQFFFTFSQQVNGVSVVVVLAKIGAFGHGKLLYLQILVALVLLEAISKMPFGPISALGSRFKSSTYLSMPAG